VRVIHILTGLQSGVDQGAAAIALEMGVPICGWYPLDGRDEHGIIPHRFTNPEGMKRCKRPGLAARTQQNVADCHALLVIVEDAQHPWATPGTKLTLDERRIARPELPWMVVDPTCDLERIVQVVHNIRAERHQRGLHVTRLMVAGPRASKWAAGGQEARRIVGAVLEAAR
jgi:hypothetical protein